ncbi:YrhB domain-containing protein [Streptomyces sp. G45]|uniref:YrhB domain-containing protein n=1 Tax=Streptomyces sp. G45 TaxID=3406627 RepID=UPI003C1A59EA
MTDREAAARLVQDELDRAYPKAPVDGPGAGRMVVVDVEEHELVWVVSWQTEDHARTGNPASMLGGNGPYLVDRVDGGLHSIGVLSWISGEWEDDYRARVRGLPVRTAVDDLHDEIRATAAAHGRVRAARALRERLPALSPAQGLAYVDALLTGDAPAPLVSVAVDRLVEPLDPVLAVRTIRRGSG